MAKYQAEIRSMFLSVFANDHFYHNVDPDDAIRMVLKQLGWTYEEIAIDLDIGLANGISIHEQLEMLGVAVGVYIVT